MITVKPNGGLGNRMRVINSCLFLAKYKQQEQVQLSWNANAVLNAGFEELFQPIGQLKPVSFSLPLLYCILKEKTGSKVDPRKKIFTGHSYFNDDTVKEQQFNNAFWENTGPGLLFNTCYDFYPAAATGNFYHLFKPQQNIQARIDKVTALFNNHTAGVHIRRTDHVPSKENSSTLSFINRMEKMLSGEGIQQFYLSTDDKSVEQELKDHFGTKIISLDNKVLDRNAKAGIADAVTDMYCLANTNLIVGSFQSTFSEVAAGIRKIPLIIAK